MEGSIILEVVIIALLILLNGTLALAEISIVASRKSRLEQDSKEGSHGAEVALELANKPTKFLSTVQIGITLVGILAGVFGGATIASHISAQIAKMPYLSQYSDAIGIGIVVLVITYFTLVLGELVPKSLALTDPENYATKLSVPMRSVSKITSPLVSFLSFSTTFVLKMLRVKPAEESRITESEIVMLLEQGTQSGVLLEAEQEMMEGVLQLGDRRVDAMMIPRTEIVRLDLEDENETNRKIYLQTAHNRLPVERGRLDNIVGMVKVRDLMAQELAGEVADIEKVMLEPLFIPENSSAIFALELMREHQEHMAVVIDEFGGTQGLVTLVDILESIVGDFPVPGVLDTPEIVRREDGSYLLDGRLPIDEFKSLFELDTLPGEDRSHYQTMSGFMMTMLGKIPSTGEMVKCFGLVIEVVDMDGFRVDKVLARKDPSDVSEEIL